jgi:hypothetical protein
LLVSLLVSVARLLVSAWAFSSDGWLDRTGARDVLERRAASIGWIEAAACDWIEGAAALRNGCLSIGCRASAALTTGSNEWLF